MNMKTLVNIRPDINTDTLQKYSGKVLALHNESQEIVAVADDIGSLTEEMKKNHPDVKYTIFPCRKADVDS